MINGNIIEARLKEYAPQTVEDEEHALKEILQEIILYGLSSAQFFSEAIFHGGTSLRILHHLPRFSEDLDFLLRKPNPNFHWNIYKKEIITACQQFGVEPEIIDKSQTDKTVKKMFLKDHSIGQIFNLSFRHHPQRKLTIKLEIDTNPPAGSNTEIKFVDFPITYSVVTQDLPSNFAGKCHAVLCREYTKGRDWYDFLWYVSKKTVPNFKFLTHAMDQQGEWTGKKLAVTPHWLVEKLHEKIRHTDWQKVASDTQPFLNATEIKTLSLWSEAFFMDRLNKLQESITNSMTNV